MCGLCLHFRGVDDVEEWMGLFQGGGRLIGKKRSFGDATAKDDLNEGPEALQDSCGSKNRGIVAVLMMGAPWENCEISSVSAHSSQLAHTSHDGPSPKRK